MVERSSREHWHGSWVPLGPTENQRGRHPPLRQGAANVLFCLLGSFSTFTLHGVIVTVTNKTRYTSPKQQAITLYCISYLSPEVAKVLAKEGRVHAHAHA